MSWITIAKHKASLAGFHKMVGDPWLAPYGALLGVGIPLSATGPLFSDDGKISFKYGKPPHEHSLSDLQSSGKTYFEVSTPSGKPSLLEMFANKTAAMKKVGFGDKQLFANNPSTGKPWSIKEFSPPEWGVPSSTAAKILGDHLKGTALDTTMNLAPTPADLQPLEDWIAANKTLKEGEKPFGVDLAHTPMMAGQLMSKTDGKWTAVDPTPPALWMSVSGSPAMATTEYVDKEVKGALDYVDKKIAGLSQTFGTAIDALPQPKTTPDIQQWMIDKVHEGWDFLVTSEEEHNFAQQKDHVAFTIKCVAKVPMGDGPSALIKMAGEIGMASSVMKLNQETLDYWGKK
jgi:hypothetical protein